MFSWLQRRKPQKVGEGWLPIETIPADRNVLVSNGSYVRAAYVDSLGHLTWAVDHDTLLSDATHWMEKAQPTPDPSDGRGEWYADLHRTERLQWMLPDADRSAA